MTYGETIDFMYARLPMFAAVGSPAFKPGFENINRLCHLLDHPEQKGKFIHIAGTNGKGSVSHMLASVLQTAGYTTGLYTSPHLKDFRERIKINGSMISEAEVVSFIDRTTPLIDQVHPSFFEITVAMAFDHFARHGTDIAVIETGLGGRLDSTNIIRPELSVITNIGYDHMQILGNTLAEIAGEKAGIIKEGVPVVIGEYHEQTALVFKQHATSKSAPLTFATDHFSVQSWRMESTLLSVETAASHQTDHQLYQLDLTGQYQTRNLLTVLESVRQLRLAGWDISQQSLSRGLKQARRLTGLWGRWQKIHQHPDIILDVAHNSAGITQVLRQLELSSYHQLHIILGMVKDKDVEAVLRLLPRTARYYFTNASLTRAMPAAELQATAGGFGLEGTSYANVNQAIAAAKAHAHPDDLLLVCGSVFLVGEVNG
ncbi:folylpolyglutamate synthase/dihydrofolate synthase family protein [Niabella terrae]